MGQEGKGLRVSHRRGFPTGVIFSFSDAKPKLAPAPNPKPTENYRDQAFASIMNQVIDHRAEMFYWLERIIESQSLPECKAIAKMLIKRQ